MIGVTGNRIIDEDIGRIVSEKIDWGFFAGKSVLVSGASGMIPCYVVFALLGLNDSVLSGNKVKVFALVRNASKAKKKFSSVLNRDDFFLIVSDVSDFKCADRRFDVIIHAASQASPKYYGVDPVGTMRANTVGTMNLLEIAKESKADRFLFVSSGEVYGVLDSSIDAVAETYHGDVDCTDVRSCYAESKRAGETMCVSYFHQYGIHASMARLSHTFGPGCDLKDGRVFADFASNIVNGENIKLNSDGSALRSFLYITDTVLGLFYVVLRGEPAKAYNISSAKETSIRDLANMLCGLYPEKGLKAEFCKMKAGDGYIRSKSSRAQLDNLRLRSLGWNESVSIDVGFRRMIDSYGE